MMMMMMEMKLSSKEHRVETLLGDRDALNKKQAFWTSPKTGEFVKISTISY